MSITHVAVGVTLDPFQYPRTADAFDAPQRVSDERQSPRDRRSNVSTQRVAVNADGRIPGRGNGGTAERAPEQRRGRDNASRQVLRSTGQTKVVRDEDGRTGTDATAKKEIQSRAVRTGESRSSIATCRDIRVLQLPAEDDAVMTARDIRTRNDTCARCPFQRRQPGRARRHRYDDGADGHDRIHGTVSSCLRRSADIAVGRPRLSSDTSTVRAVAKRSPLSAFVITYSNVMNRERMSVNDVRTRMRLSYRAAP